MMEAMHLNSYKAPGSTELVAGCLLHVTHLEYAISRMLTNPAAFARHSWRVECLIRIG